MDETPPAGDKDQPQELASGRPYGSSVLRARGRFDEGDTRWRQPAHRRPHVAFPRRQAARALEIRRRSGLRGTTRTALRLAHGGGAAAEGPLRGELCSLGGEVLRDPIGEYTRERAAHRRRAN